MFRFILKSLAVTGLCFAQANVSAQTLIFNPLGDSPVTLTASPQNVVQGNPVRLTWSTDDSSISSCRLTGLPGSQNVAPNGTLTIRPNRDLNVNISCDNNASFTDSVTVSVSDNDTPSSPPIVRLAINPERLFEPTVVNVTWSSQFASSCFSTTTGVGFGLDLQGQTDLFVDSNTIVDVTCSGQGGVTTARAAVGFGNFELPPLFENSLGLNNSETLSSLPLAMSDMLSAIGVNSDADISSIQSFALDINGDSLEDTVIVNRNTATGYVVLSGQGSLSTLAKTIDGISDISQIRTLSVDKNNVVTVGLDVQQ
jgi:hypothetical protein